MIRRTFFPANLEKLEFIHHRNTIDTDEADWAVELLADVGVELKLDVFGKAGR